MQSSLQIVPARHTCQQSSFGLAIGDEELTHMSFK
eukprot:CAMPEP_0115223130 /NCGR_PEP_ID=MMETSP0270-20121206/28878_1 /TAXON_ID=71861 /ORGANISM="Scrippsiella trochoidea, Strain CCMP3099" /LENGTH=34 /DNA_ID= /DNA_START= /DNA_END= /DNA_ORIENTATION=